ncbi:hypothetical protein [Thioclava pacifica]|uniref:Uncharacterized protein n=1 Tax=Thioclava pacifica DSM 10166 TaxID=1353537 RepID=A0A074JF27_9RHOB|nr:hypothetical protein [Thioclava pacifica]KEO56241.1 hypothetical protein TP2_01585 [Thioclava pacifica DSM 10166]
MPELIRLYIKNVIIGFFIALAFVGLLLWANVGNLRHLILTSDIGYIAMALLVVFNTIVFSGVQFAIAIMRMAEDEDGSGGGKRDGIPTDMAAERLAIPVPVDQPTSRKQIQLKR